MSVCAMGGINSMPNIFLLSQKRCSGVLLLMTLLHCYVDEASGQKDYWCNSYYSLAEKRQI